MSFDDYYQLGHVAKSHGLSGEVIIHLDVSDPNHYRNLEVVFVNNQNQLIPYTVLSININGAKARVTVEGITSRDQADQLVGNEIYLPVSHLPKLAEGEYYFHDIIGFEIISEGVKLGKVEKIFDLGSQSLLSYTAGGNEVLIPLNREILKEVDLENRKIVVDLPDGLVDLYT